MGDKGFMALLNPAIALLFSLTFLVFWTRQRNRRYILAFAGAYFLLSLGFFNSYLVDFSQHILRSIVSNGSYLVGTLLLSWGLCRRAGVVYPIKILAAFALAGAAGAMWFAAVEPNIVGRLYSVNFAVGAMFMITAFKIGNRKTGSVVDRLLFWVVMLTGAQFFIRTSVSLYLDSGMTAATYHQSTYWAVLSFFVSLFSLAMALSIIAAVADDIMRQIAGDADTDPLTGLPNRRGFDRRLVECTHRANRTRLPVSLIILDVDRFKSINDRFGHQTGDQVLKRIGVKLAEQIREQDTAARFGGEEFCILLPDTDRNGAQMFAEGLRTALELQEYPDLPLQKAITASFGVAERQAGQSFEELYAAADRALYQAKNAGRNCVKTAAPYFTPASPALNTVRTAEQH